MDSYGFLSLLPPLLALGMAMYYGGTALSRLGAGWLLDKDVLSKSWSLLGLDLTAYHTIFLFTGCGVIIAVFLLALVPSVMDKARLYPRS